MFGKVKGVSTMNETNLPERIGGTFCIEYELGSGGSGAVYKAWHSRLQKHVVIKELKPGPDDDPEARRTEVEALKNVKSAHLPQVFDFLTEGDRIFTVIEFIDGNSFDKLLERGVRFTQPQVVKWYRQLASALEIIHKQNVYHRDIKPANIMLTPSGDVCLIDFNAALVSGNDVRIISRSLGYASPEQYEIYEWFKNAGKAPINYGTAGINTDKTEYANQTETEKRVDVEKTEYVNNNRFQMSSVTDGIDWVRSDIYSLGATMYHLLSGVYPPERATDVVKINKYGRYSEGLVYIIEQSMQINPSDRFATAQILSDAVQNISKHTKEWKLLRIRTIAASIILPVVFALFMATALYGINVMEQEKEERFYAAVFSIQTTSDPHSAFDDSVAMYWDRIDPYLAMARRLWNDDDIDACRAFIEQNLGNIAKFQSMPEAQRAFGDIYYILGNCHYFQAETTLDYYRARGFFELAVRYVQDNPIYFRDYAITLARTGFIADAEQVLETARGLNLDTDSVNLLNGEIAFAKNDFDNAIIFFNAVITATRDDYIRYRAYHTSDEIFKLIGQPERSVELLSDALIRIPLNRVPEMTERLADAHIRIGDYKNAIILFEQLMNRGAPRFHIMQNLAILYQNAGDFANASDMLHRMADEFRNDYRVPMRQAFLEAEIQSAIENEQRDYSLMEQYYNTASALYKDNVRVGESDPEMQQLDLLIEQLRRHNWLN
jgi:serine/threonine-protein kinase